MRAGREGWKAHPLQDRLNGIDKMLQEAVAAQHGRSLRLILTSGDIIHLRPSGNAPELRCYTEADTHNKAELLLQSVLAFIGSEGRALNFA